MMKTGRLPSLSGIPLMVLLCLGLTSCSSMDLTTYREAVEASLESTLSEARTAELAGGLWMDGRATHAVTSVVVSDSEEGVGAESQWFAGQQPPDARSEDLRKRTNDALDEASSAVEELRIAVERSDRDATRTALAGLRSATAMVEALAEELG
ncbi:hypothetical protein [Phycicoccus avicenniae]|uniref:hypothetical protein n=1 Tax=Phycicoccus avicenniae TaxID=2828860 RepID=UPI003D29005A